MATLSDYKGLSVVEGATGAGGIALTGNFKELADRAPNQSASNPGVNDDSTKGFAPGDQWLNTATQVLWACVSNSTGAAVWKSLYKRTATGMELIPAESSDSVSVLGILRVAANCDNVFRVTTSSGTFVLSVHPTASQQNGILFNRVAPDMAISTRYSGINSTLNINANTLAPDAGATAAEFVAYYHGTGSLLRLYGSYNAARNASSGTVTNLYGSFTQCLNTGSGTITNTTGNSIVAPVNSGGGTFTNVYGSRIYNQGLPGASRACGLAISDQSDASNNTLVLLGGDTSPSGDWTLYSTSTKPNHLAGALTVAGAFVVTGAAPVNTGDTPGVNGEL